MLSYEELMIEAEGIGLSVIEKKFRSGAKGLCKGNRIGVSKDISTTQEKLCVLAEEIGHCLFTVGDILDQDSLSNIKQEHFALKWARDKLVPQEMVLSAYDAGYTHPFDLADFLQVDEAFLVKCLKSYGFI